MLLCYWCCCLVMLLILLLLLFRYCCYHFQLLLLLLLLLLPLLLLQKSSTSVACSYIDNTNDPEATWPRRPVDNFARAMKMSAGDDYRHHGNATTSTNKQPLSATIAISAVATSNRAYVNDRIMTSPVIEWENWATEKVAASIRTWCRGWKAECGM